MPRPRQSTGLLTPYAPDRRAGPDDREPVARWQALRDAGLIGAGLIGAGLIGSRPPLAPAVLASIRAAEAVVGGRRSGGAK